MVSQWIQISDRLRRLVIGLLVVAIATVTVSCGGSGPEVTTYTPEKLAQVEIYAPGVNSLRQQFPEISRRIETQKWIDVTTFIHGPLGELRARMDRLSRQLLPQDQAKAKTYADDLYNHLEILDKAATERDLAEARQQYLNALEDFDSFLDLIPETGA
jgi:photosystem II protein PsbQ